MKLKLIVVVDQSLKMPKGKLAREVMGVGIRATSEKGLLGKQIDRISWEYKNNSKAVVCKTMDLQSVIKQIKDDCIQYVDFIDAGLTVFNGPTLTCVAFFINEDREPQWVKELKLL